jgi:hypothetical protein
MLDSIFEFIYVLSDSLFTTQNCYFDMITIQNSPLSQLYSTFVLEDTVFVASTVVAGQSIFNALSATSSSVVSILSCNCVQLSADSTTTVDRDLSTFTITPAAGVVTFTFPIAFIHAPSYIGFTQISGTFSFPPFVTSISNTNFVYHNNVSGNGYTVYVQNYLAQGILI